MIAIQFGRSIEADDMKPLLADLNTESGNIHAGDKDVPTVRLLFEHWA